MTWSIRIVALALAVGSYWWAYQYGRSVAKIEAALAFANRDSDDRLIEALGQRDERREEQRRAKAQEEARIHAYEQTQISDTSAAGADAAGQRLQHDVEHFAATINCPGLDSAAFARGQAAVRAAMVLSDLLARADARAGELAKAYDKARIAGLMCEASYGALINQARRN